MSKIEITCTMMHSRRKRDEDGRPQLLSHADDTHTVYGATCTYRRIDGAWMRIGKDGEMTPAISRVEREIMAELARRDEREDWHRHGRPGSLHRAAVDAGWARRVS